MTRAVILELLGVLLKVSLKLLKSLFMLGQKLLLAPYVITLAGVGDSLF